MDNDQHVTPSRTDARAAADTTEIPWARTTTQPAAGATAGPGTTRPHATAPPPATAQPELLAQRGQPTPSGTAPAVAPPVWSGKKTAIAAALAIGFASVGAVGAAAVLPTGSAQTDPGGRGFPGGGQFQPGGGQLPQGQLPQGQLGQGQLGQQNQQGFPGGQVPGRTGGGQGVPQGDDDDGDDDASTT